MTTPSDDVLRALIEASVDAALRKMEAPQIRTGTVVDASDQRQILVVMDGDTEPITAPSGVGPLEVGWRVWVTFYPPSGVLITGAMQWYDAAVGRPPMFCIVSTDQEVELPFTLEERSTVNIQIVVTGVPGVG